MRFGWKRKLYESLPTHAKRVVCSLPYPLLAGSEYRATLRFCRKIEFATRHELTALQEKLLGDLLDFATSEVPAYFSFRGIVGRLSPFEALKGFPLLTKQQLVAEWKSYTPRCLPRIAHHVATTGGTSGEQLRFFEDDTTYARENAYMHCQWSRAGYSPHLRKATFRGVTFHQRHGKSLWQENPIHNELQLSPFHLNETTAATYLDRLVAYAPRFLHGYPSAISVLAEYVNRTGLHASIPPITAVLLGSEACSSDQRSKIARAFNARVYTWYGHSERTILGGECEFDTAFHHFPNYGVVEIISPEGRACRDGEVGELVGTGFLNRSMPMIRYRTDDFAKARDYHCRCGRMFNRFSDVEGHRCCEGIVIGRNGTQISSAALNMHNEVFNNVVRFQYRQSERGRLELLMVPNPFFTESDKQQILLEHKRKLGDEIEIELRFVDEIPLTSSGKQRRIIQNAA